MFLWSYQKGYLEVHNEQSSITKVKNKKTKTDCGGIGEIGKSAMEEGPVSTISASLSGSTILGSTNLVSTNLGSHHISGLPPAPPTRRSELPPRHPKDQVLLVTLTKNFKRCEKLIIRMWRSRWGWQGRRWQGTMGERHLDIFLLPVDQCPQARVSKISNVVDHFDSLVHHNNVQ